MRKFIFPLFIVATLFLAACVKMPSSIIIPEKMPPAPALTKPIRVAVVLGGGGARGYAHIGVLKVLQQANLPIDLIVGASAGSVIGSLYADKNNAFTVEDILLPAGFWDFADLSALFSIKGVISGAAFQIFLLNHMKARYFAELPVRFIAVASDLKTGEVVPIQSGPLTPAVTASAAIPGLLTPVRMYGHVLVDGAMVDPVPVDIAQRLHPKLIIAVDISQSLPKSLPITALGVYERAYELSWLRLSQLTARNADIVIHPDVGQLSMFDLNHKQQLIKAGEVAARKALPQIRKLLHSRGL